MGNKQRIFYLDFIRAIAVVLILITHYNACYIYLWSEEAMKKIVFTSNIANLYIGDFGVSLFLVVSGAALMTVYQKGLDLKTFYKKRFWSIYPMFWIAYFAVFMYSFWMNKGIDQTIPKQNIIFSIMGMDLYLCEIVPVFTMVGEWFLGFIIIFYLVFPLIRICIEKYPIVTVVFILFAYCVCFLYYPLPLHKSTWLFTRLPELAFGMYFVKYRVKLNWKLAGVGAIVLIMNSIIQPAVDKNIQTSYVGIAAFLMLGYMGVLLSQKKWMVKICCIISKYSYAVFLIHHFIINRMVSHFDLNRISVLESYLLFLLCCCIVAFFSKVLYDANLYVLDMISKSARRPE